MTLDRTESKPCAPVPTGVAKPSQSKLVWLEGNTPTADRWLSRGAGTIAADWRHDRCLARIDSTSHPARASRRGEPTHDVTRPDRRHGPIAYGRADRAGAT